MDTQDILTQRQGLRLALKGKWPLPLGTMRRVTRWEQFEMERSEEHPETLPLRVLGGLEAW